MLRGLERLFVNDKRIKFVQEYKYLGCIMTNINCARMVEERTKAGVKP